MQEIAVREKSGVLPIELLQERKAFLPLLQLGLVHASDCVGKVLANLSEEFEATLFKACLKVYDLEFNLAVQEYKECGDTLHI